MRLMLTSSCMVTITALHTVQVFKWLSGKKSQDNDGRTTLLNTSHVYLSIIQSKSFEASFRYRSDIIALSV